MFKATSGPPADTATESARLVPVPLAATLNISVAGRAGPDVDELNVIGADPDAVQLEQRPGGIPATGVMFAVYGPLAAAGTLIGFCPLTVTVTTQNAGMSSLCLTVNCDRPVPQSIVMVPIRDDKVVRPDREAKRRVRCRMSYPARSSGVARTSSASPTVGTSRLDCAGQIDVESPGQKPYTHGPRSGAAPCPRASHRNRDVLLAGVVARTEARIRNVCDQPVSVRAGRFGRHGFPRVRAVQRFDARA